MAISRQLAAFILVALLFSIGCSGDDDDGPMDGHGGAPPAAMIGSWTFQSVTVNGAAANLSDELAWVAGTVASKLHIQTNSAYVLEQVNINGGQLWVESGFVFVDGNEIDVNTLVNSDGQNVQETTAMTFTLNAGVFTLREVDQGRTIVFTMTM